MTGPTIMTALLAYILGVLTLVACIRMGVSLGMSRYTRMLNTPPADPPTPDQSPWPFETDVPSTHGHP